MSGKKKAARTWFDRWYAFAIIALQLVAAIVWDVSVPLVIGCLLGLAVAAACCAAEDNTEDALACARDALDGWKKAEREWRSATQDILAVADSAMQVGRDSVALHTRRIPENQ